MMVQNMKSGQTSKQRRWILWRESRETNNSPQIVMEPSGWIEITFNLLIQLLCQHPWKTGMAKGNLIKLKQEEEEIFCEGSQDRPVIPWWWRNWKSSTSTESSVEFPNRDRLLLYKYHICACELQKYLFSEIKIFFIWFTFYVFSTLSEL